MGVRRQLLGYIEYPSHYEHGLDSPVGLAFAAAITGAADLPQGCRWFESACANIHDAEQRRFLVEHQLVRDPENLIGERDRAGA